MSGAGESLQALDCKFRSADEPHRAAVGKPNLMNGWPAWVWWLGAGVVGGLGITLLAWALVWDRAKGRARCPRCWYDMAGAAGSAEGFVCPECGKRIRNERGLKKTRRRWKWAAIAVPLLLAGTSAGLWPTVKVHGWPYLVPTRALVSMAFSETLGNREEVLSELNRRFYQFRLSPWHRRWIVSVLIDILPNEKRPFHRRAILAMLTWVGGQDPRVTPTLLSCISDADKETRAQVVQELVQYQADPEQTLGPLSRVLSDVHEDPYIRFLACRSVAFYRDRARELGHVLLAATNEEDERLRWEAVQSVWVVGVDAQVAVPLLLSRLVDPPRRYVDGPRFTTMGHERKDNPEYWHWEGLVLGLGHYPESASVIVPVLLKQLAACRDYDGQHVLIRSLGMLGASDAAPALRALAVDGDPIAVAALAAVEGRERSLAVTLAKQALDLTSPRSREARKALLTMDLRREPVFELIVRLIEVENSSDPEWRLQLELPYLRASPKEVIAALSKLRTSKNSSWIDMQINEVKRREWPKAE